MQQINCKEFTVSLVDGMFVCGPETESLTGSDFWVKTIVLLLDQRRASFSFSSTHQGEPFSGQQLAVVKLGKI